MRRIASRLDRLEQVTPLAGFGFILVTVPTEELKKALTIFRKHGITGPEEARDADPATSGAVVTEIAKRCPTIATCWEQQVPPWPR